jgi:mannitol/fructose-specific phosphotransferase system IIA component (Ntr-type)
MIRSRGSGDPAGPGFHYPSLAWPVRLGSGKPAKIEQRKGASHANVRVRGPDALIPNLTQTTKEGVIREMVEALKRTGHIKPNQVESIVKALLKREQLGSTGIGHGVAIPHTKHESVDRPIGTVAVSHQGVDFQSIDNEAVYIFVLLISPVDRTG